MKRRKDEKWDRTKIGVGASVTVKVREIDENIREGESGSMSKELVGLPPTSTPLPRHNSWTASYRCFLTNLTLVRLKSLLVYAPSSVRRLG